MDDRILLVTGGGRGIGAATARLAGARGYTVCINYVSSRGTAEGVARAVEAAGGRAHLVQADTGDADAVKAMFATVDREAGRITHLVNSAGITGNPGKLESYSAADIRRILEVNVVGVATCIQEAVARMSTDKGGRGGAIVNLSSIAAEIGGAKEWTPYAASKGAVSTLTIGAARELAGEGIRVNAIMPGLIDTEMHAGDWAQARLERLTPGVPMGRTGSADEVAEAVLWLLSDAASYVTGAVVPVTGGR